MVLDVWKRVLLVEEFMAWLGELLCLGLVEVVGGLTLRNKGEEKG